MGTRKYWIAAILLALLFAGIGSYWLWPPPAQNASADQGELDKPAADFTLPDLKGKPFKLSSLKGKTVLLDFWATWCGPCIDDIPTLKSLQAKYKEKGLVVLGVSIDDSSPKEVAAFTKEHQFTYPVVLTGGQDKIPDGYNIFGLPAAYLIDANGTVIKKYYGPKDEHEVGADIQVAIKRATPKSTT
jgi:peroxiredoxin